MKKKVLKINLELPMRDIFSGNYDVFDVIEETFRKIENKINEIIEVVSPKSGGKKV